MTENSLTNGPRPKRPPLRVGVIAIVALITAAATFVAGRVTAPEKREDTFTLVPENNYHGKPNESIVRAIVLGQTRDDRLTFGEFIRRRTLRLCGSDTRMTFPVGVEGPTQDGAYLWIVHGIPVGGGCRAIEKELTGWLGGVWSDTGEIIAMGGKIARTGGLQGNGLTLRKQPEDPTSFLAQFRRNVQP